MTGTHLTHLDTVFVAMSEKVDLEKPLRNAEAMMRDGQLMGESVQIYRRRNRLLLL